MNRIGLCLALFLALLSAPALAQDWGELATPISPVNLRQARDLNSPSRDVLMPGETVRVDFLRDGWYAAFRSMEKNRDEAKALGYVRAGFLKPVPAGKAPAAETPAAAEPVPVSAPLAEKPAPQSTEPRLEPASPPAELLAKPAQPWGRRVTLQRRVNLSRSRSVHSGHIRSLEAGTPLRVEDLDGGWCAVYAPSEPEPIPAKAWGYALREDIDGGPQPPALAQTPPAPPAQASAPAAKPMPSLTPAKTAAAPPPPAPAAQAAPQPRQEALAQPANPFVSRRPEAPQADSTLHGFRYKLLDSEEERLGEVAVIELKVFLDVAVLPEREALKDFALSMWKQKRQDGRELVLDIFLPDMDLNGLAYAVAHFKAQGDLEFWTRRTLLFGTRFSP